MNNNINLTGSGRKSKNFRIMLAATSFLAIFSASAAIRGSDTTATTSSLVTIPTSTALAAGLLTLSSSMDSTLVSRTSTTTTTTAQAAAQPAMQAGVNLGVLWDWNTQRAFSNLLAGSPWRYRFPAKGIWWGDFPKDRLSSTSVPMSIVPGEEAIRTLNIPSAIFNGKSVGIKCSYVGKGKISLVINLAEVTNLSYSGNNLFFTWNPPSSWNPLEKISNLKLAITETDPSNPVRNLDCREGSASPTALYDPEFISSLSIYKTLRFMDWQNTNANLPVTWATRTIGASETYIGGNDGIAVEHMVALANQAKKDPWFTIPWNADEDYVRRFATYVRDNLSPDLKAYVEVSNEVWNWGFKVTTQAYQEGLAEGLDSGWNALPYRYAEKTAWAMKIWSGVFAGQTSRIVRVASVQAYSGNGWGAKKVMEFRDTPQYVDAIAVAPYFGRDLTGVTDTPASLDNFFSQTLPGQVENAIKAAEENAVVAKQYGKRLVAYEAGPHIVWASDVPLLAKVSRDPRMGTAMTDYLGKWQSRLGGLMVLYNDTGNWSKYGAWGLREYAGQPLTQATKAQAVTNFVTKNKL